MANKKGSPKTGGRAAGTPNKATADLRAWIKSLIEANQQQINTDLMLVEPYQRLVILDRLLSYVVPKMASLDASVQASMNVEQEYDRLKQLLQSAPDEAIERLAEKVERLRQAELNKQEDGTGTTD
jgi:hypothetical protein